MLLALGLGLWLAALFAVGGAEATGVLRAAGRALYRTILVQALLPQAALALGGWLAAAWWRPRLDTSWRTLLPGVTLLAVLCFVPVGALAFEAWSPAGPRDVAGTCLLLSVGVAAALLLPRRLLRPLGPGAFAPTGRPQ